MDGIELELCWSNLRSVVTEQAKAMQRTAFSAVVREAGDLAYGLFDRRGRMIVQADTGTPGHINCLAACGAFLAETFHGRLEPGDVLISNDPWKGAGHGFDITVFAPIFRNGQIIGYVGSTNHHIDIGGLGVGVGAHDVHEEGLLIPPLKLVAAGKLNETLLDVVRANVRTPNVVEGDLMAQVGSTVSGGEALNDLCDRYGLADIDSLADAIIDHSESAMRRAIRQCAAGTWEAETCFDIPGGEIVTLHVAVTVNRDKGELVIDFAGSSPQSARGVNVVMNYTAAYATFAVRSILNPELPNNVGSLAPIRVVAPEGSVVNCRYPAPVAARHIVGMYVPIPIMKAFYHIVPDRVIAPGPAAPFAAQALGSFATGEPFVAALIGLTGGMGARATKAGLAATYFPAGVSAIPIEIIEAESPVVFRRKELRHGSGGNGRSRGGDGQIVEFMVRTALPWTLNASPGGKLFAPEGLGGGESGKPGIFRINGRDFSGESKRVMDPSDVVYMETPGAGGFGAP